MSPSKRFPSSLGVSFQLYLLYVVAVLASLGAGRESGSQKGRPTIAGLQAPPSPSSPPVDLSLASGEGGSLQGLQGQVWTLPQVVPLETGEVGVFFEVALNNTSPFRSFSLQHLKLSCAVYTSHVVANLTGHEAAERQIVEVFDQSWERKKTEKESQAGQTGSVPSSATLGPGEALVYFANFYKPARRNVPYRLLALFTFTDQSSGEQFQYSQIVPVDQRSPKELSAPVRGEWMARGAVSADSNHRTAVVALTSPFGIHPYLSQRYAIDFVRLVPASMEGPRGEARRAFLGTNRTVSPTVSEWTPAQETAGDHAAAAVYASCAGTVVSLRASVPVLPVAERQPRENDTSPADADVCSACAGEEETGVLSACTSQTLPHVLVDCGDGHFILYAHVRPERGLEEGKEVQQGERLGVVQGSHLHFQVMDFREALRFFGLPFVFKDWTYLGTGSPSPPSLVAAASESETRASPSQEEKEDKESWGRKVFVESVEGGERQVSVGMPSENVVGRF
uniref:Peptidase M23 domain-containing protein n=1 Tax=Chromera velia CCMP2878 TaxID=1169474 RepID=A0A0G4HX39_9ALVE|eukprot:Cvel_9202.t1-p1 / transcript=Cvel_9202.t1 / gene=Cvel_9202 / organism=Chromera_velia_CCMP2878 / gene_product=hypothetical protein / transcript_product=hypothetical protein / location=Cvel_scaffold524:55424-57517(-) / protein_length=508 / sequence_SO=supercontig / SO=protein_coding / is_pseudo=false